MPPRPAALRARLRRKDRSTKSSAQAEPVPSRWRPIATMMTAMTGDPFATGRSLSWHGY